MRSVRLTKGRLFARIALCVSLGVFSTYAASMTAGWVIGAAGRVDRAFRVGRWEFMSFSFDRYLVVETFWPYEESTQLERRVGDANVDTARALLDRLERELGEQPKEAHLQRWRCGWPWICLEGCRASSGNARPDEVFLKTSFGINLPARRLNLPGNVVLYPLKPILPQFAATVSLFAAAWGTVVFLAPLIVRRVRGAVRRRRHRCASCGYSISGLAPQASCPECGAGRR